MVRTQAVGVERPCLDQVGAAMKLGVATVAAYALLVGPAWADDPIPKETHPISQCRELPDKSACLAAYWSEYKTAIMVELEQWKTLLPAARSGNDMVASRALGQAINGGWYVHNHWDYGAYQLDESDQIPFAEFEAVYDCRAAIINLKFWLVGVTSPDGAAASDPSDYKQSAAKCESSGLATRPPAAAAGGLTDQIQALLQDPADLSDGVTTDLGADYGHDIAVQFTDAKGASRKTQIARAASAALRIGKLVLNKSLSPPGKSLLITMALKSVDVGREDTFSVRFAWSDVLRLAKRKNQVAQLAATGRIEAIWFDYWSTICANEPPPERFAGGDGQPVAEQDIENPTGNDLSCQFRY